MNKNMGSDAHITVSRLQTAKTSVKDDHTRVCCSLTGNRLKRGYLQEKSVCKEQPETFSLAT